MKYTAKKNLDALPSDDFLVAGDYSEEAIPERDPSYRLPGATICDAQTVEHLPAAERLALARCLEQLGMSPARAAAVVNL
jgi:hypothetical protein